jgi:hypothetical protein
MSIGRDIIVLLNERRRELWEIDRSRPDYESCRRSLEQAIDELVRLWLAIEGQGKRSRINPMDTLESYVSLSVRT